MSQEVQKHTDTVKLTIDGIEVVAPKGELVIRTAERLGIDIPRFCDHPLLAPAGACRQCLVDVEGQRKPVASCTQTVADGMVVRTQLTSEVARKAQEGVMELLLINHPLDCPMCDKGGECPLQNQAMQVGRSESRFHEHKREYEKPINISSQVLLDRERCVLCQRCTRFSEEIAGDKFIDLMDRSSAESIGIYRDAAFGHAHVHGTTDELAYDQDDPESGDVPFNSYFSGNTIQICPVGALTSEQYRFRARPFDLVSSPSVCEHCSSGCAQRTDHRRGKVLRRLAGSDAQVNEEWNCDKGRWGFRYATAFDRLTTPLVRDAESGELREASWTEALRVAAEGLRAARDGAYGVGVLTGGRLTVEDAYAYAKFARVVLNSNDVDFRARPLSAEEADFLASSVVGETGVTYADLEQAKHVVLVGFEPEEESPIVLLRLRKTAAKRKLKVTSVAPFLTRGSEKAGASLAECVPGQEPAVLSNLEGIDPGTVILVGERLATVRGGFSAAAALAARTGAKLAWVPRRAGDRGAVDAGCLPNLLPGGRSVADAAARAELSGAWGVAAGVIPSKPGRDTDAILAAAAAGKLGALVVAGVDPSDLAHPQAAEEALDKVGFLVSLEQRMSSVSRKADVVFPVAVDAEKSGSYVNWEGRLRTFEQALETPNTGAKLTDARVLDALAAQLGTTLGVADVQTVRRELGSLPATAAPRPSAPAEVGAAAPSLKDGEAILATWAQLIDLGSMTDGDEVLAGTARPPVVRLSKARAAALGVADGDPVTVGTARGAITLPAALTEISDDVVWLPTNSPGSTLRRALGVSAGAVVTVSGGTKK
ncbi:NADH-quinone oxidoreductase [Catellatospora sp. TT07R-123]|uniref:NADH-quinone oxidoreductase subunit G n=1 Tax=Catellatospora sp. TT07R-123 TaxID=2733863 RepID=UPI001B251553|nr:NADH-quinone oxidoreductase subunit G [Catellatospora sp. TT07R-123]GHJ50547.1 NADH-quinone oxidoreductase [Catellatospora sp. TT07R-123]